MGEHEVILPGALGKGTTKVPVYLPDRTEIGTAEIDLESGTATIHIQTDSNTAELFAENLAGLSVLYFNRDDVEEFQNKQGEETDAGTQTLDS